MTQNTTIGPKYGSAGDLAVSITNPTSALAGLFASVTAFGGLNVTMDSTVLFSDTFEGVTPDTTNRWTVTGTVAPTQSTGSLSVNPGATASATVAVNTIPTFTPVGPLTFAWVASIEATTIATGNHRFMGVGTPPSAPGTSAAPLQDAIGFEIDTTGALRASVYSNGTRTFTTVLTIPTDGAVHRYAVVVRGDIAFWYRDTFDIPLTSTQTTPMTAVLPMRFASLNSASVTGTPTMTIVGAGVLDQSRAALQISDGTYPWRKNKIGAYGDQNVSITNPVGAAAGLAVGVTTYGFMRATVEPHALFSDPFDGAVINTTDRWTLGGTVAPTATTGRLTEAVGATLSATSTAVTQPTFIFQGLNFLAAGWVAKFETVSATPGALFYLNSHRFMGLGLPATTLASAYTASATTGPMLDAIGYEIDTDGKMYPVVYVNGVRTRPTLVFGGSDFATGNGVTNSALNPGGSRALADGNFHSYGFAIRGDYIFWYVDGSDYPCAQLTFRGANYVVPNTQQLPLRFHTVNGAVTAPSGTMTMQVGSIGVADTGSNHVQIADSTNPWRKATISKYGSQYTNPGPSLLAAYSGLSEATFTLVASTRKDALSIEHAATATKTVKVRRITVAAYNTTAVTGYVYAKIFYGTAATSGGTVVTATKMNEASAAAEAVIKTNPTIVAATQKFTAGIGLLAATTGAGVGPVTVYDATAGSDMDALTLRAGVLETITVAIYSTGANALQPLINIQFTEE